MNFERAPAPHLPASNRVSRVMGIVLAALLPAAAVHTWLYGAGLAVAIALAAITALGCEALGQWLRGRPPLATVGDLSALVAAVLLAFSLPPLAPWYVTVAAAAFAILVAKQLYGGLGFNTFNPAMAGYVAVFIAFPEAMTRWPPDALAGGPLPLADTLRAIFLDLPPAGAGWDAITMATPLDQVQSGLGRSRMMSELLPELPARGGLLALQLAIAGGGLLLLALKIIRWHIPAAVLAGILVTSGALFLLDPETHASPWFHLTTGSAVLCAFFIATDPVSAATSRRGRLLYGALIGMLVIVIRVFASHPDGVAFAILLANMCVPLIDYLLVPRAFGHPRKRH